MLSALEEALDVVEETTGQRPDLDRLAFDDPAVYDMICRGDTIGCFQVESRAQAQLIPHFRPRCFEDLIVEISLIRPGPIQGNMVQPYLRRRLSQSTRGGQGGEPVTYLHPLLEPALAETLGVIVFQEQVLKVARDLAGFTGGQGELLRRALGHKHGEAELERLRGAFLDGAAAKGVPSTVAAAVFDQLKAFGGYAFAKSHAASFAVIVYQSAWLKCYHPLAFYIGLLRCQPMGFYSPAVLVNDAKRHGIRVLPVDANHSAARYTAEGAALRIGLSTVKGLGELGAAHVQGQRAVAGAFTSLADFCRRTRLPRLLVENLVLAGALDSLLEASMPASHAQHLALPQRRRELLWQLGLLDYEEDTLLLDQAAEQVAAEGVPEELPHLRPLEALALELRAVGVSAGEHVMAHHRAALQRQGVLSSQDLARCQGGELVWVAGQVTVIQSPPTAKGFWFITLEDEFGMINIIVTPDAVARYRRVWRGSPLLAVWGRVQREGGALNVLGQRPWRLAASAAAE
jgi:error-prone DNA polymerase